LQAFRRLLAQLHYWLLREYCLFRIYSIEIFTSVFARKDYEQMVVSPKPKAGNFTKKLLKLVN